MRIPKIKFSPKYRFGTPAEKLKTAEKINSEIFEHIVTLYDKRDRVPIREIEREYKKNLPETIYLSIKKLTDKEEEKVGGLLSTYFKDDNAIKFKMSLPACNNQLKFNMLPILMHESAHLLDYALNPKKTKTYAKVINRCGIAEDLDNFYFKNIYKTDSKEQCTAIDIIKLKQELRKLLTEIPSENRIITLNYFKEALESEIFAFKEEQKYISLINDSKDYMCFITRNAQKTLEKFKLNEKLETIKKIILEIISSERGK